MRLAHISDLHLGKRFDSKPLLEEQRDILEKIKDILVGRKVDVLLIAGDIYDKSIPSEEAVEAFDTFLTDVSAAGIKVLAISGNHDSAERLAFASSLLRSADVYISPVYRGKTEKVTFNDESGPVNFYLQPFVKPLDVRVQNPDMEIATYTDALRVCVDAMDVNTAERNVILVHQFVTSGSGAEMWSAEGCESEEPTAGGLGNVDLDVFKPFDYVALGHLHKPQNCHWHKHIRYCGSPLKYSFSEAGDTKSVTIVDMGPKGQMDYSYVELEPLHDVVDLVGTFAELTDRSVFEAAGHTEDYVRIILTDENEIPAARSRLAIVYSRIVEVRYMAKESVAGGLPAGDAVTADPLDLFEEFFKAKNPSEMNAEQRKFIKEMIEKIW